MIRDPNASRFATRTERRNVLIFVSGTQTRYTTEVRVYRYE